MRFCVYTLLSIKIEITFSHWGGNSPAATQWKKKNGNKRGLRIVHDTDWMGHYHINEGNMWGDGWELRKSKVKIAVDNNRMN